MGVETIKQKLHQFIDTMEDRKAEAMYALFEGEIEADNWDYTDEFKAELDKIEADYENGGSIISAEEAKQRIESLRHAKKAL